MKQKLIQNFIQIVIVLSKSNIIVFFANEKDRLQLRQPVGNTVVLDDT